MTEFEFWKPLPVKPCYEVSSLGRVRSYAIRGPGVKLSETPHLLALKNLAPKQRYHWFLVYVDGRTRRINVHRAVCELFNGPPPEGATLVRHLDGDVHNNRATNLAWGTPKQNSADAIRHGRHTAGARNGRAKLTPEQAREIRTRYQAGESPTALGLEFGVSGWNCSGIGKGLYWKDLADV